MSQIIKAHLRVGFEDLVVVLRVIGPVVAWIGLVEGHEPFGLTLDGLECQNLDPRFIKLFAIDIRQIDR